MTASVLVTSMHVLDSFDRMSHERQTTRARYRYHRYRCDHCRRCSRVGLYDQSELNRHVRRVVGTTPGAYARELKVLTAPGKATLGACR
jgi:AraC-like DNA-binding protein